MKLLYWIAGITLSLLGTALDLAWRSQSAFLPLLATADCVLHTLLGAAFIVLALRRGTPNPRLPVTPLGYTREPQ